jgi:hypothetical protein
MCIYESRIGANELKLSVLELLFPVIRKLVNQPRFASHHLLEIESDLARLDAPRIGVAAQVEDFRRVKQRFAGHAAAQDAESADFIAAFNEGGLQAGVRGRPCRGVAGAAAANHSHIKIEFALRLHDRGWVGESFPGKAQSETKNSA